ncbi:MAG: CgeB family protein [Arcticibacter sp.]
MKISMFYHSLLSDWNHGNAHFLRGVVAELLSRGHDVKVYEPKDNWSLSNLISGHGDSFLDEFRETYPQLQSISYDANDIDLPELLKDQDLVIVHEWNEHRLVKKIGECRSKSDRFKLMFHDTHHRAVTEKSSMEQYDLQHYDGVLAFGNIIRDIYLKERWTRRAWTWHEAADTRIFHPVENADKEGDLVWVGNWGDDERTQELQTFLIEPVKELGLKAKIYGVRYPDSALKALEDAGIEYGNWLPNYKAPEVFSKYKVTVHVPRRPYVESLPGIPTIRPFEAMACGIPLVCSPWDDAENLFTPGKDFLVADSKESMKQQLLKILNDADTAQSLAAQGLQTIQERHTCAHRVDELLQIVESLKSEISSTAHAVE